ncbi:DUF6504 family protein [Nocardiopsis algeriensis]|uniref:DUF6504 domain-containing protein n=1 Tax=Nocardiopsis algeriensis TaxID=1478215 RepID=A0A841IM66_9ACTN|nr:hypothetical protein [Nocardiopsis algeriensis]
MSLLNEQIDVRSTAGGNPAQFTWRGRTFRVLRIMGDWSPHPEAPDTRLIRVSAESEAGEPSIIDIRRDAASDCWTMRRQWN